MEHTLKLERLFTLGDYKNLKVTCEIVGISQEDWDDVSRMNDLRSQLASEVLLGFAVEQMTEVELKDYIQGKQFENLITELLINRHPNLRTEFTHSKSEE